MIFKSILIFLKGILNISVEGFFVERFINKCKSEKIMLDNLHIENSGLVKANIPKKDFKRIKSIARITNCRIKINKKIGLPFIINKYRKRKIFAIAILVIAIFIFILTKFIWNIEVIGNKEISENEILEIVGKYGISIGKLKKNIDLEKIINEIRLEREDIAWIGIDVKGTNVIISMKESEKAPNVIDKNDICNIISSEDAIISKIIVQSGTAKVKEGDLVKIGDVLVEGTMEGKYTGIRNVHSEAMVLGIVHYEKKKKEEFVQYVDVRTGNMKEKKEICFNNFRINFNKRLLKFQNYDKIISNKKIKIFSNFYLPFKIVKTTYLELEKKQIYYTEEELISKIEKELEDEMEDEYKFSEIDENDKTRKIEVNTEEDGITLKLIYEIQKEIGEKQKIN